MNLPTLLWQTILNQLRKLYGQQKGTRRHYTTLQCTRQYGKCAQTQTFKLMPLTWQTDCCTSRRMAFKVLLKPMWSFAEAFSVLIAWLLLLKNMATYTVNYTTCVGTSMICLCSISTLTLCVIHTINYSRPSTVFPYYNRWKVGGVWERG